MPRKTPTARHKAAELSKYTHPDAGAPLRPEVGAQSHFKKRLPPAAYRYDASLAPALDWDGENPAREQAEACLREIAEAVSRFEFPVSGAAPTPEEWQRIRAELETRNSKLETAQARLRALSRPFLNWAGKAERLSFEVPTLPLFVHERLSTQAIVETLKGHKRDKQMGLFDDLFGAPERDLADNLLQAYEYGEWVNRMILGDSLAVMNSLLRYEHLGGQVQMIYIDPPYGVKFGSNFQPFVRRRDVSHNDDADLTREPEMVQAYRDTWELGLHSYLTYLRDRLLLARDLLAPSGSVFVQISDENLHHVREVMDEVFGAENFCTQIAFRKTTGKGSGLLDVTYDSLLWYAKEKVKVKFKSQFETRSVAEDDNLRFLELPDGTRRRMTQHEVAGRESFPVGARPFRPNPITSARASGQKDLQEYLFEGKKFTPGTRTFSTDLRGMQRLEAAKRLMAVGNTLTFVRYLDDFPYKPRTDIWDDTRQSGFGESKLYVVQTSPRAIERCLLMTTDPGDLVLDPTCGSGTTAYVAEQWGRRWITCDTSRVPLALARQRLLTATFDYHELKDPKRGPAGGFVYKRRQNAKGEEVGGIVPHVTLKSIANDEPPAEEVLVDRPETLRGVVRVTGPFCFEATIPTAEGLDEDPDTPGIQNEPHQAFVTRMIEVLKRAPVLRLAGNRTVTLKQIRPPAKTLGLSAEALIEADKPLPPRGRGWGEGEVEASAGTNSPSPPAPLPPAGEGSEEPVAILFGPENGALSERAVREAWDEAGLKRYTQLFVIGFAIEPKAREFIDKAGKIGIPASYLQATMDLQMGDLLKNMRSSQVFSVCGLPDVALSRLADVGGMASWQVKLLGLDSFDPATMEPQHLDAADVPAWFLDTDYNGLVFRVRQAFFPRTGAWENLKRALKAEFEASVWEHLAGSESTPFGEGDHRQIAVKVIDPRGNELMVVKRLEGRR